MRPGQQAPESGLLLSQRLAADVASMRPGQQAPESSEYRGAQGGLRPRFNEARAASPGILQCVLIDGDFGVVLQ